MGNSFVLRTALKLAKKKGNLSGFTLIELLVVVSIIAALFGVGAPALLSALNDGRDAAARAEVSAAAKTCSLDQITGSSEYAAANYPLLTASTCGADATLTATSATGNTFSITLAGGVPGNIQ